jgi:membrane protein
VLGAAVALIGSDIITTVLTAIANRVDEVATGFVSQTLFWMVVENFGSITVLTLMLAAMFRLLPETRVEWRDVFVGAFVTSVLFTAIKHAVGWYLGHLASYAAYGAIGGFLALLTWIYMASLFLF